jgi:hypothetical protein
MSLYFVSYDLRKPGRNYEGLYDFLKTLGAKKIVESTYCFNSTDTAINLRDRFKEHIDSNDAAMVSQIEYWASCGTDNTPKDL